MLTPWDWLSDLKEMEAGRGMRLSLSREPGASAGLAPFWGVRRRGRLIFRDKLCDFKSAVLLLVMTSNC